MKSARLLPAITACWAALCLGLFLSTILPTLAMKLHWAAWFWRITPDLPNLLFSVIPSHAVSAGTALLVALAGWTTGGPFLAWAGIRRSPGMAVRLTAGLVLLLPLAMLGLGLAGLFRTPLLALVLALPAITGLARIRPSMAAAIRWKWAAIGAVLLSPSLLCALVPEIQYDALQYHLALPRRFLEAGRVYLADPWPHANFHLAIESLLVPALAIGGDGAAKLVNWLFFPLLLVLTRLATKTAGITGIFAHLPWLIIASSPLFSQIAGQTFTDCGAACAITAAVLLRLGPRPPAFAIGALVGAAGAVKIPSMGYGFIMLLFLAPRGKHLAALAGWALPLIAWPVKSFLLTGSPYGGIILTQTWPAFLQGEHCINFLQSGDWTPPGHHSLWLTFPFTLLRGAVETGFEVSPFLPALLPLALLPVPPHLSFLRWAALASFLLWPFTGGGQIRFLVPFAPNALIACCAGNKPGRLAPPRLLRIGEVFISLLGLVRTCGFLYQLGNPINAALGTEDARSYLARIITPTPIYMAVASRVHELPRLGRPYVTGDIKSYYWPRNPRNDSQFLNPLLFRWARDSHGPGEIAAKFRQSRLGCVAHNMGGAITMADLAGGYRWTSRSLEVLQRFWATHMIPAGEFKGTGNNGWISLYEFDYRGKSRPGSGLSHWFQVPYTEGITMEADIALFEGRLSEAEKGYRKLARQWPRFTVIPLRFAEISRLRGDTGAMREHEREAALLVKSSTP